MNNKTDQLDEEILFLTKNIDDAIIEIIKKECDMMSRDKNKLEQYAEAIVKSIFKNIELEKEIERLKKELDNSKFGAQCSVHELEYDRKTLIKENTELKEEIKKLESKTKYLIPYCFECGAEYEDESCYPDKSISYIHPRFLKELKEAKFGVQQFRS